MAIGQIITCISTSELINKAEELSAQGIHTEFVSRYALKIVKIN